MKIKHKAPPLGYVCFILTSLFVIVPILFRLYARTQQDNVTEAVVRSYIQSSSEVIFISVRTQSSTSSFMRRFSDSKVPVRPLSQGIFVPGADSFTHGHYVDKVTANKGWELHIEDIMWRGPFKAQVLVWMPGVSEHVSVARTSKGWRVVQKDVWIIE